MTLEDQTADTPVDDAREVADLFPGGGDMGARMRAHDWSASVLGRPAAWPQSLRTVVSLLLNSRFPMFVAWGPELGFLYNDAYAEILGSKHPAAMGRPFQAIWPEIWTDISPRIRSALAGEATFDENLPLLMHRKGYDEQTWFTFSYSPVHDDDGVVAGMFCTCAETTRQVQAEEELRQSETRFRTMADAAPMIVWIMDGDARPEFFNRQWHAYVGSDAWPGGAAATATAVDYVHPDDQAPTIAAFDQARTRGGVFEVEHRVRRHDGAWRWFLVRAEPYRDPETGQIVRWYGASVDIHDIKETEQALARSEARLRELSETLAEQVAARSAERDRLWTLSQDMLARADYAGMMSAVSPAWGEVLGWSEQELLTRGYSTFMHPDDMPPTLEAIGRMGETGKPTRFENRIATKDGDWRNIEWTVAPEPDGANFIAVGRDISATRAREAQLAAAQEQLRQSQKMEAMGQLTGGVAHDFNNLLMPIIGSLDMLVRREVGTERERRLIEGALQSAERAKTLVQRLLAFARRQPLQPTAVDLKQLVGNMAELIDSSSGPRVEVRVRVEEDLPPAVADPNQLEMAILNLAVNARDAMPEGGVLTISAERAEVRAGEHGAAKAGDYIRLAIADTGVGMDEATRARAVEPFFSTKGIGKGTGLGLSMAHGLALQLGGGLSIDSAPGQGATISLLLPMSAEAAVMEEAPESPRAPPSVRGVALLVDDEDLVRMTTADMLTDLGYEVVEAASGAEALRLLDQGFVPDLLVTDHLMPGMTGVQLAAKSRLTRPDLPVLVVSGYAEAEGLAVDLPRLTKPFRNAELAEKLAELGIVEPPR